MRKEGERGGRVRGRERERQMGGESEGGKTIRRLIESTGVHEKGGEKRDKERK